MNDYKLKYTNLGFLPASAYTDSSMMTSTRVV